MVRVVSQEVEVTEQRTYYLCGVDWQHEINDIATKLYSNVEDLKEAKSCWKSCGIVKLTVNAEWIVDQNLGSG